MLSILSRAFKKSHRASSTPLPSPPGNGMSGTKCQKWWRVNDNDLPGIAQIRQCQMDCGGSRVTRGSRCSVVPTVHNWDWLWLLSYFRSPVVRSADEHWTTICCTVFFRLGLAKLAACTKVQQSFGWEESTFHKIPNLRQTAEQILTKALFTDKPLYIYIM